MKVGIFGGSFDPIHEGHVSLAKYVLDHTDLDEVWLMVSPRNPLKAHGPIATDQQRLEMARLAVEGIEGIKVSDFEFNLPIPSYTYKTLTELKKCYPEIDFSLIIGGDNWTSFDHWRNPKEILNEFGVIIYPRPGEVFDFPLQKANFKRQNATLLQDAPEMPISSTEIRHILQSRTESGNTKTENIPYLNKNVQSYIRSNNLYNSDI